MRYEAADIRVKTGLCQALASQRIRTCRKYVTLFCILISSLFFVNSARAESALSSRAQDDKTITVQATVPLTPEFAYSIRKNSSLVSEKAAFALGEEIRITVRIAGGNDEPLRGHTINLQAVNVDRDTALILSGETDTDGLVQFTFSAGAGFLGSNILRVVDVTYGAPIPLHQELAFLVYEPEDDQEQPEKAAKNGISGDQSFASGQRAPAGMQADSGADVSRNSGTIVTIDAKGALTRAGP